jgi:hypothetical protein
MLSQQKPLGLRPATSKVVNISHTRRFLPHSSSSVSATGISLTNAGPSISRLLGCVRLPFSFAPKLFQITTVGEQVINARDGPS